jgi:hypothetical protein
MNKELGMYQAVTKEEILNECCTIFDDSNCSTMHYRSDK